LVKNKWSKGSSTYLRTNSVDDINPIYLDTKTATIKMIKKNLNEELHANDYKQYIDFD
jgi:hypothetical protein